MKKCLDFAQDISQSSHLIRFGDDAVRSAFAGTVNIGMKLRISPDKHFEFAEVGLRSNPVQDLKSIEPRHAHVQQNKVRQRMCAAIGEGALAAEVSQRLFSITNDLELDFARRKLL